MTKRFLAMVVAAAALSLISYGALSAEGEHKYVGVKKCAMCHKSEAKGNQYGKWLASKHAKAYERLASPEAEETAKRAGVTGNPQEAPQCVKCHVTAYGVDKSLLGEGYVMADGVQCESCHGAGGDYTSLSVMKDKAKAMAAGLIMPTKEACVKCHNPESPNYKELNYEESFKEIAHPNPQK